MLYTTTPAFDRLGGGGLFELTICQLNGTELDTARRERRMREDCKKFIFPDVRCNLAKDVGKVVTTGKTAK